MATQPLQSGADDELRAERLRVQRYLDVMRLVAMSLWTAIGLFFADGPEYRDWEIQTPWLAGYTVFVLIMMVVGRVRPDIRIRTVWLVPSLDATFVSVMQYVSFESSVFPVLTIAVTSAIYLFIIAMATLTLDARSIIGAVVVSAIANAALAMSAGIDVPTTLGTTMIIVLSGVRRDPRARRRRLRVARVSGHASARAQRRDHHLLPAQ